LIDPTAYTESASGKLALVKNGSFNPKSDQVSFTTASADAVLILAASAPTVPWDLIVVILLVIGAMVGVAVLLLRQKQKTNYDEYLRSKYYNL
jgi:F0F1-type ATP synthase assembly protein I